MSNNMSAYHTGCKGARESKTSRTTTKRLNSEQLRCSVHLFVIEHSGSGNVGHLLEISLAYDNYANCANPKQGVLGKCLALFENGYKASKKDKYVHF